MSTVYCPKCHALRTDRTGHCRTCGQWQMATTTHDTVGALVLSPIIGAMCTAVYGVCVYLVWEKWVQKFGGNLADNPNAADNAFQLAVVIGAVVFTLTTLVAAALLLPRKQVADHQPA